MTIPKYDEIMLPFLKYLGDGMERKMMGTIHALAESLSTSEEERKQITKGVGGLFLTFAF